MWGELASVGAAACWAAASLIYRRLSGTYGALAVNLAKGLLVLPMLMGTAWLLSGRPVVNLAPSQAGWLAMSGIAGLAIGDSVYFAALVRIGPSRTLLIWSLAPAITAVLAWPVLGEPITGFMLAGMTLTLLGIGIVVWQGGWRGLPWEGVLLASGAAACQAFGNITTKLGGAELSGLDVSVARVAFSVPLMLLVAALTGSLKGTREVMGTAKPLSRLAIACFIGTFLGIWLSMVGLLMAPAGVAATLMSTSPLFVIPLAALVDREPITARAVVGASIAIAGVALLFAG